jgi:hypothetical protein
MNKNLRIFGIASAIASFLICLLGGLWILIFVGIHTDNDNAFYTGVGFYFIGKALFVGSLLLITTLGFKKK